LESGKAPGHARDEIAAATGLSEDAVRTHIATKLTRAEAELEDKRLAEAGLTVASAPHPLF
jgi:hypothetical protein